MNIESFPLFKGLDETQIESFVAACQEITLAAGTTFIEEGSQGDRLYLVLAGEVQVFVAGPGGDEQELVVIRAPAVIGEIEALTGVSRAASVRTRSELVALELLFETLFERLEQRDPAMIRVFIQIARVVARRLAAMNRKFAELEQSSSLVHVGDLRAFQEKLVNEWTV